MGRVDLTEVESLEVENALLREKVCQERILSVEIQGKLLKEILANLVKARDLLSLRLITVHHLEDAEGLKFTADGKAIEFQDKPPVKVRPSLATVPPRPPLPQELLTEDVEEPPEPEPESPETTSLSEEALGTLTGPQGSQAQS